MPSIFQTKIETQKHSWLYDTDKTFPHQVAPLLKPALTVLPYLIIWQMQPHWKGVAGVEGRCLTKSCARTQHSRLQAAWTPGIQTRDRQTCSAWGAWWWSQSSCRETKTRLMRWPRENCSGERGNCGFTSCFWDGIHKMRCSSSGRSDYTCHTESGEQFRKRRQNYLENEQNQQIKIIFQRHFQLYIGRSNYVC